MGNGGIAPPFLTLALDGSEWSTLHCDCIKPRERAWLGGPLPPARNRTPAMQIIVHCSTDRAVPPFYIVIKGECKMKDIAKILIFPLEVRNKYLTL
jgi:hypothetical protein